MHIEGFPWDFHPESVAVLKYLQENATTKSRDEYPLSVLRQGHYARCLALSVRDDVYDVTRSEQHVPSPHVPEGIPVWIYRPKKLAEDPKILIYFHGGGFVLGHRMNYDTFCNITAQNAECLVVNVEYRLAPEHQLPAALDDAIVVINWVKANQTKLGGTEKSKIGVGGDSAGGTITASVTHDVKVDFQLLVYPQTFPPLDFSTESMQKYKKGPLLDLEYIDWFNSKAIRPEDALNPRIASILGDSFQGLPPAIVIIAELDPLYDSSWAYANKLKSAGVEVEVHEYKGAIHAFFGFAKTCREQTDDAYEKVVNFIKRQ